MTWFTYSPEVSFGDILKSVSIIVAAAGVGVPLYINHTLEIKKQANEIRSSAAKTLAAIDRWRDVSLLIFARGQPLYVETSKRAKVGDTETARDFLYSSLHAAHTDVQEKLSDERIEAAYVELFKYHPSMSCYFKTVATALQRTEEKMFDALLDGTQRAVLHIDKNLVKENTAALGDELRDRSERVKRDYFADSTKVLQPAEQFLGTLILTSDFELLNKDNLKAPESPAACSVRQ